MKRASQGDLSYFFSDFFAKPLQRYRATSSWREYLIAVPPQRARPPGKGRSKAGFVWSGISQQINSTFQPFHMMAKMVPNDTISVGIRDSTLDTSAAFRGLPRDDNARGNHAEIAAAALNWLYSGNISGTSASFSAEKYDKYHKNASCNFLRGTPF